MALLSLSGEKGQKDAQSHFTVDKAPPPGTSALLVAGGGLVPGSVADGRCSWPWAHYAWCECPEGRGCGPSHAITHPALRSHAGGTSRVKVTDLV